MAKNFRLLEEKMSPESLARSDALAAELEAGLALSDLRGMLDITQADVATRLGIAQSNVSRIEQRDDMLISTLGEFVGALGGTLRLSAVFPEGEVNLTQFDRTKVGRRTRGLSALG